MYFVFALPALILALYAQWKVKATYQKMSQQPNMIHLTGAEAARRLLDNNGLRTINLEGTPGELSDHYDPSAKVLRLSQGVAGSSSVAALGIVAHEVGHAVQDATGYSMMRVRATLVPAAQIGSTLGVWPFIIGFLGRIPPLAWLGFFLFIVRNNGVKCRGIFRKTFGSNSFCVRHATGGDVSIFRKNGVE